VLTRSTNKLRTNENYSPNGCTNSRVEVVVVWRVAQYSLVRCCLLVQRVPGLSWGVKSGQGVTLTPHPLPVPLVMKE